MTVRFTPEAIACLADVARFYRDKNPPAAKSIRADIRATLRRVELDPLSYALIGRVDIRRAVTRRYAYLVYFRMADDAGIDVVSIRHPSRRPRFDPE